jgi:hypothetical protein
MTFILTCIEINIFSKVILYDLPSSVLTSHLRTQGLVAPMTIRHTTDFPT